MTIKNEMPVMEVNKTVDHRGKILHVLDKGYVRLDDYMGDDLAVVNAARVSFAKKSNSMTKEDANLINFLIREQHSAPFRHAILKFEIKAPLMVARQHFKYIVGSSHQDSLLGWSENSRRYVTADEEFYIVGPTEWRSAPENKKQGSGEVVDTFTGGFFTDALIKIVDEGLSMYKAAMEAGICAEQARLFLPAYGLYVNYVWTASLQSVMHFLSQRLDHHAQKEIQELAKAIHILSQPLFPISFQGFNL